MIATEFEKLLDRVVPRSNKNLKIEDYNAEMNTLNHLLERYGLNEEEQSKWLADLYNGFLVKSRGFGEFRLRIEAIKYYLGCHLKYGVKEIADWQYLKELCDASTILERKATDIVKTEWELTEYSGYGTAV